MRISGRFLTLIFVTAFLAASVNAVLGEERFVPPPRRIDDVLQLLQEAKSKSSSGVQDLRERVAQSPPGDASQEDLTKFFKERANAAKELGLVVQQAEDLRRVDQLLEAQNKQTGRFANRVYRDLAWAELQVGNMRSAIAAAIQGVRAQENSPSLAQLSQFYAWSGDIEEAKKWLEKLKREAKLTGKWRHWNGFNIARAEATLAEVQGRWQEYQAYNREIIKRLLDTGEEEKQPFLLPFHIGDYVDSLLPQGRVVEAEAKAREALLLGIERQGWPAIGNVNLLRKLARTLIAQGRYQEAGQIIDEALAMIDDLGLPDGSVFSAFTNFLRINIASAQYDWDTVLAVNQRLEAALADNRVWYDQYMEGNPAQIIALIKRARMDEALKAAQARVDRYGTRLGDKHYDTAEARALLGMSLAAQGRLQEALNAYQAAVPVLLSRSRQSDGGNGRVMKAHHRKIVLEAYIDLLRALFDEPGSARQKLMGESLRVADLLRAQGVQRALAANAARGAARNPALAALVREEQDLRRQVSAIYGRIADLKTKPPEEQEPNAIDQLVVLVDQFRERRAAAMEEIEDRFPDYADLINPKPPGPEEIRKLLKPGEALISFYFTEQRGYVWTIPKAGESAFAMIDIGRDDLAKAVDRLRRALDPKAQSLGDIPTFEVNLAHELYGKLLAPVVSAWQASQNLLVVADGALGYLPLSLLVTEPVALSEEAEVLFTNYRTVPWLVRQHAITALPSTTALKTLRRGKPTGGTEPFIGFGDPVFSRAAASPDQTSTEIDTRGVLDLRALPVHLRSVPDTGEYLNADLSVLPRLPDTASEVREIALALSADPTKHVFLGEKAREKRVKTMDLSGVRVLAFATHGLVPGDLNGLVEPALALSAPKEAGPEDDGLLTMTEILGLKLDADWVVLSACNTGAGSGAGAEAVSGLGRAFFYAGSRALLVTNWPVETTSARALTTDIFSRQAADPSLSRAEALRRAMVGLMDGPGYRDQSGQEVFVYAHPIFWAPFSIVGDGGSGG